MDEKAGLTTSLLAVDDDVRVSSMCAPTRWRNSFLSNPYWLQYWSVFPAVFHYGGFPMAHSDFNFNVNQQCPHRDLNGFRKETPCHTYPLISSWLEAFRSTLVGPYAASVEELEGLRFIESYVDTITVTTSSSEIRRYYSESSINMQSVPH